MFHVCRIEKKNTQQKALNKKIGENRTKKLMGQNSCNKVPYEVWFEIFGLLEYASLFECQKLSKYLRAVSTSRRYLLNIQRDLFKYEKTATCNITWKTIRKIYQRERNWKMFKPVNQYVKKTKDWSIDDFVHHSPYTIEYKYPYILVNMEDNRYSILEIKDKGTDSGRIEIIASERLSSDVRAVDFCPITKAIVYIKGNSGVIVKKINEKTPAYESQGKGLITSARIKEDYVAIGKMNGKVVIINWKTQDAIIYRETNNAKVCSTCHLSDGLILIMDSHWNYKIIKLSEDVVVTESIELGTLDVPRNTQSTFEKSGYKVASISERKADENSAYPEPQSQPEFLQVWPDTKDPSSFLAIAWCAKKVQFAKITIAAADMPVQTHTIKTFSIVANSDSICRCVHPKRLFISDNSYLDPHTRFCNYTLDGDGTVLDLGVPTVSASENSPILDVDLSGVSEDATPSLFAMDNDSLVSVFNDGTVCYLSFN